MVGHFYRCIKIVWIECTIQSPVLIVIEINQRRQSELKLEFVKQFSIYLVYYFSFACGSPKTIWHCTLNPLHSVPNTNMYMVQYNIEIWQSASSSGSFQAYLFPLFKLKKKLKCIIEKVLFILKCLKSFVHLPFKICMHVIHLPLKCLLFKFSYFLRSNLSPSITCTSSFITLFFCCLSCAPSQYCCSQEEINTKHLSQTKSTDFL